MTYNEALAHRHFLSSPTEQSRRSRRSFSPNVFLYFAHLTFQKKPDHQTNLHAPSPVYVPRSLPSIHHFPFYGSLPKLSQVANQRRLQCSPSSTVSSSNGGGTSEP
ncbi:uncharacterized protein BKA78DRAFT_309590 [Phyllosticta capitalensis]|uniref:uncharacterized protein n=1 Tax=Phyllosticta capitalensis TaxID=121624 RepID=UPI003130A49C